MRVVTPEWVKDAVFYQIFPDRFAKSAHLTKPTNLEAWDTPPTTYGYKGGDLYGVIEKLDYLQDLGINAIYFTPIFQSASNHRYHTHDYYQVDPLLGGNKAFYALRDALHKRNIKLVLDGVFNHASRGIYYFNDILENGKNSAWYDWFTVYDFPLSPYDESKPANYEAWVGLRALPKWNTDNPQVREYIMQIAEHWIREGIDGWRLDVAFCITSGGFWNEFRQRVKALNPEAYIVGEVWGTSTSYLQGDQFDAVMNYPFAVPTIQFVGQEHIDRQQVRFNNDYDPYPPIMADHYADRIEKLVQMYDWQIAQTQLNLLDSHDTPRMLTVVREDKASARLAALLLLTCVGAPSIYYGDEIGLPGQQDPDCRRTILWDKPETWDKDLRQHYQQLIALRHQYKALRRGRYVRLYGAGLVYAFARELNGEVVIPIVNSGKEAATVTIPLQALLPDGATLSAVYGQGDAKVEGGSFKITVGGRSGIILVKKGK